MIAKIVIGLGYGDEGKGLATDYFSRTVDCLLPLVVRFSGGPQAGHTVWTNRSKRHVHSNYGSGTYRSNFPSFFTEHTCVYPVTIEREKKMLEEQTGNSPILFIHPLAKVITPFDVWANRSCDANLKNGTCGLGIGKTMHRNETSPFKLYAIDLMDEERTRQKLVAIKNYYHIKEFADELRVEVDEFFEALKTRTWEIADYKTLPIKATFQSLILEGSQGILLDMDHGVFPNVTYANTTSKNAIEVIKNFSNFISDIDTEIVYITRAYSTRHGNGEFKESYNVRKELQKSVKSLETNVYNEFQGRFKIGEINYDSLNRALEIDFAYHDIFYKRSLFITCIDQRLKLFDFDTSKLDIDFYNTYRSYSKDGDRVYKKQ